MKIFKDNSVYVQKNDMVYLNQTDIPIPASIFMKVFGNGITIIDERNRYEFVKFEAPEEVEFFQNQDWIVDYNEIKNLTEEELLALGQSIAQEKNKRAEEFNKLPKKQRQQKYESVVRRLELFDFKMYSIRDMIMFKRGELEFPLPRGVEKPTIVVAEQYVEGEKTVVVPTEEKKESGIKRFFKSLRKSEKSS